MIILLIFLFLNIIVFYLLFIIMNDYTYIDLDEGLLYFLLFLIIGMIIYMMILSFDFGDVFYDKYILLSFLLYNFCNIIIISMRNIQTIIFLTIFFLLSNFYIYIKYLVI